MIGQGKDVETDRGAIKAANKALPLALFAVVVLAVAIVVVLAVG